MERSDRTFEISACLGRGGFGEVYRARMRRGEERIADVALKVLRRDIDPDGQAVQRLRDEGKLLSQLNHPSILKVYDLVVLDGRISLITEFVDGDDLSTCLEGPDAIGTRALLAVIGRVASALDAAWTARPHGRDAPLRMVHRDIKPSNIRLSRHGHVKLLDFGIARTDHVTREARTRTDMMVGSPAYMAPERFLDATVRLESDVFSLGAVLYEGLTGTRFYGDLPVPMQVGLAVDATRYAAHLAERLDAVALPAEIRQLLAEMLAPVPEERPGPAEVARRADALADAGTGPTLDRYCRSRSWSTRAPVAGELDGRVLTEGTLERPRPRTIEPAQARSPGVAAPLPAEPTRPRGSIWGWVFVGIGAVGLAAMLVLGLLSVLGLLTLPFAMPEPDAAPEATTQPAPEAEPAPDPGAPASPPELPAPDAVPAPAPPEPLRSEPPRPPSPAPEPRPVEPDPTPVEPVPEPTPEPAGPPEPAVPPGYVALEGDVVTIARGAAGRFKLPAAVPPGRYVLYGLFNGLDEEESIGVEVASGETVRVRCSTRMGMCSHVR